jgi:hypothetical protein
MKGMSEERLCRDERIPPALSTQRGLEANSRPDELLR